MNENQLDIIQIREKCNLMIDYLKSELVNFSKFMKDRFQVRMGMTFDDYARQKSKKNNSDLFDKLAYAFKFGMNVFAIAVLKIDHEFLDFSTYKSKKKNVKESLYISYFRVLDNLGATLDNVKNAINIDDSHALSFYRWLVEVAYKDEPFWKNFFSTIESMGVNLSYSVEDRKNGFGLINGYTFEKQLENGVANKMKESLEKSRAR